MKERCGYDRIVVGRCWTCLHFDLVGFSTVTTTREDLVREFGERAGNVYSDLLTNEDDAGTNFIVC